GRGGDGAINQYGVQLTSSAHVMGGTSGTVSILGTGGANAFTGDHGVVINGTGTLVTSAGANVQVTGVGGGTGASSSDVGVAVQAGGVVTAGGAGTVTVQGTGGSTTSGG